MLKNSRKDNTLTTLWLTMNQQTRKSQWQLLYSGFGSATVLCISLWGLHALQTCYHATVSTDTSDLEFDIEYEEEDDDEENSHTEIFDVAELNLDIRPEILSHDTDSLSAEQLSGPEVIETDNEHERFGPYALIACVGGDQRVEVWVAGQQREQKTCILKRVPKPALARVEVANISEEIRISEQLKHFNMVETYGGGIIDGIPYITMEMVDGMSLKELHQVAETRRHPLGAVLDLGIQIAEVLDHVHKLSDQEGQPMHLVHGNLRPQNIFVTKDGITKLGEIAVSYPVASDTIYRKIRLPYLAPEQFGRRAVGPRADIFTLGLLLIELLAGEVVAPFGSLALQGHRSWYDKLKDEVPEEALNYLAYMIQKSPNARPTDTKQVARELRLLFQRYGAGRGLAAYFNEDVFGEIDRMISPDDVPLGHVGTNQTSGASQQPVFELPEDALEEVSYPSTVSLIIEDIDWNEPAEPRAGSIKILNPGISAAQEIDFVPPLPSKEVSAPAYQGPPRTLRLGKEGRRLIAEDPAFRHAIGLPTAKSVVDPKEWEYYFVAGDELGPRIVQKSLTSARPYQDQKVIFLRESELISAFDLEVDASPLVHGSVWAGDESGYDEAEMSPLNSPAFLRYHERMVVRSAPRRNTSVRGKVLRFLGK